MKSLGKEIGKRIVAGIILCCMSFNMPGSGIRADSNTPQNLSVDQAANGVPVINISTPSPGGTSVNTFTEFNVDGRGVEILNNTGMGRGYLSGLVNPNPNLKPGHEARAVVFQVNGLNRSEIEGYISALSPHKIDLFISNENGIYTNGAGFININRAVLTTGKVNIRDGDIVSFTAKDGSIVIGEKGLDLTGIERVDIISRTQEIAGKVVADGKVNMILGQNDVDLAGMITPIVTSDSKPAVALNAGALGSVYSNGQINIVSTEKGVGVNLKSSLVSEEELRVNVKGSVQLNEAISGNVSVVADNLSSGNIRGNRVEIASGGNIENRGKIAADSLNIHAAGIDGGDIRAGNLNVSVTGMIDSGSIAAGAVSK